jgi:hypothetical protein
MCQKIISIRTFCVSSTVKARKQATRLQRNPKIPRRQDKSSSPIPYPQAYETAPNFHKPYTLTTHFNIITPSTHTHIAERSLFLRLYIKICTHVSVLQAPITCLSWCSTPYICQHKYEALHSLSSFPWPPITSS